MDDAGIVPLSDMIRHAEDAAARAREAEARAAERAEALRREQEMAEAVRSAQRRQAETAAAALAAAAEDDETVQEAAPAHPVEKRGAQKKLERFCPLREPNSKVTRIRLTPSAPKPPSPRQRRPQTMCSLPQNLHPQHKVLSAALSRPAN